MADKENTARSTRFRHRIENFIAVAVLSLTALLPLLEAAARGIFRTGIPHVTGYIQHLVIWICFTFGIITSREKKHLSLSVGVDLLRAPARDWVVSFTKLLSVVVTFTLFLASLSFALRSFGEGQKLGFIPITLAVLIMPAGFLIISVRFVMDVPRGMKRWITAGAGIALGICFGWYPLVASFRTLMEQLYGLSGSELPQGLMGFIDTLDFSLGDAISAVFGILSLPILILLLLSALAGTPIFIILGGTALILFFRSGGALEVVPNEAYTMLTGSVIPAIPLFTLTGFILSESKAGERLVKLFRAFFGWFPGGLAVMSVAVCAFFTTFTGGSGVTILALGALLSFVLVQNGYKKEFSIGLLTSSGSIGLLFFPSLPIIMYGVIAQISIKDMFVGGFLPGVLMVITLSIFGIRSAMRNKTARVRFKPSEVLPVLKSSIWDILLPVIILISYLVFGFTTLVETAALSVIYVIVIAVFVHKDIALKDLPKVFLKCIPIIGGVFIILANAKGLSYYIVDAEIPTRLTEWFQSVIHSKYVFLILLNLALLVTGCFMDIFSAITVVAPLIIPLGRAYGINEVHLGIIFLANLELGYLTPPVGMNLFLASYRFNEPLSRIYRHILPFLLALLVTVLLITYIPQLTTFLVTLINL